MNTQIDIGRVVSETFQIYRDQAGVLLPAALVVFLVEGLISGILVAISLVLILVALIVQIVATTLYQGMVVQVVADVQDGRRDASVGDILNSVRDAILPLIGAGLLAGLGIAFGFLLLIVPGLILLTIWAVVAPVVVLERPGVVRALGRSRELVRGNGWQVFGTIILFFLILVVAGAIIGAIGAAFGDAGRVIADIVSSVLFAPLVALAASVLYFNLRRVKGEGTAAPHAVGLEGAPAEQPPGVPQPGAPQPGSPDPLRPEAPPPAGEQPPGGQPPPGPPPQQP
jgi:hypothetical protein